jgi:predicted nucleic acid-binding protein
VEYLRGSSPGKCVRDIIASSSVYTSSITLAEVVAHVENQGQDAGIAARAIQTLSEIIELDSELALHAADRYSRAKKTDKHATLERAYLLETAKKVGAEIVSGDKSFVSGRITPLK